MKLKVGAVDADLFKRIYLIMPNSASRATRSEQAVVADQVLLQCLNSCGKAKLKVNVSCLKQTVFELDYVKDTQHESLVRCEQFLAGLTNPEMIRTDKRSELWWIRLASHPTTLLSAEHLAPFIRDLHDSKFLEVYIESIYGKQVKELIDLCKFFDESIRRNCLVISQFESE